MNNSRIYLLFFILILFSSSAFAQEKEKSSEHIPLFSLQMPDTLHKKRFWISAGAGAVIYGAVSTTLWNSWYKNYDNSPFHFFDDRGEWENMDKAGHFFTTYYESRWLYNGARWTGMDNRKAAWTGVGIAYGLQLTIEIMDGFSEKWGFSLADVGMNTLGAGLFIGQEYLWEEQRIVMKVSSNWRKYPTDPIYSVDGGEMTTLQARADNLYGTTIPQRFLKDYNAQIVWASANIHSFLPNKKTTRFPKWLNVAVGYSAENMFAGYGYEFTGENDATFIVDSEMYPRYNQAFLSLDVDLTRIPTKSRVLQTIFSVIGHFKIPAPTLEYSKPNGLKFHAIR